MKPFYKLFAFLFFSFLMLSSSAYSQEKTEIKTPNTFRGKNSCLDSEGNYLVAGVEIDREISRQSGGRANPESPALVKWHPQKGLIWSQSYDVQGLKSLTAVQEMANGDILAAGGTIFTSNKLLVISPKGKIKKELQLDFDAAVYDLHILSDGILMAGYFAQAGEVLGLIKLDFLGNIIWKVALKEGGGNAYDDFASAVIPTKKGYFLATEIDREIFALSIDLEGKEIWKTKLCEAYSESNDMILHSDGNLWLTGKGRNVVDGEKSKGAVFLASVDQSGKLLWKKSFGNYYGDSGEQLLEMKDGSVMMIARTPQATSSTFHISKEGKLLGKTRTFTRDFFFGIHHLQEDVFAWFEMSRRQNKNYYFTRKYE